MPTWPAAFILISLAVAAAPAYGQGELVQPIWSAPAPAKYLADNSQSAGFATGSNEFGRLDSFSLPVIGLQEGFASKQPSQALADSFIGENAGSELAAKGDWWPLCAGPLPQPQLARDSSGTWYAGTYDFGCLQVTIVGDRGTSQSPSQELSNELSEPSSNPSSPTDETGDPEDVYSVVLDTVQFGVPYTLTIDCNDDSKSLCRDRGDQLVLLSRFTIRAGRP